MDLGTQNSVDEKLQQKEAVMLDMDSKGKTKIGYDEKWQNQDKDVSASEPGNSSTTGSILSSNINSSNSELSVHDDDDEDVNEDDDDDEDVNEDEDEDVNEDEDEDVNEDEDEDVHEDEDEDVNEDEDVHEDEDDDDCDERAYDICSDYDYMNNFIYEDEDDCIDIQSRLDNVALPPGVEASLPWLKGLAPGQHQHVTSTASTSVSDPDPSAAESKRKLKESKRMSSIFGIDESKSKIASSPSSTVAEELRESGEIEVMPKSPHFKQFDTVDDFSDHHYSRMGFLGGELPPNWAKKIQDEWKILERGLPDTIFVRVYESRMELLRAVMIGPSGTPYHDGLFVFDCLFPPSYPNEPPMVYYYSGGLRLNPNLYECGKVCLSLLGTWSGNATEMWSTTNSTMLQVLVSIQGLILNAKPFFNEPGYENSYVGEDGERRSRDYNEEAFILSLKTMMYTLRKPPKHFEDLVTDHFRNRAREILVACKAYKEGAVVGSVVVKDGIPEVGEEGSSSNFKLKVGQMMNILITNLTRNGSTDCEQFRTSS